MEDSLGCTAAGVGLGGPWDPLGSSNYYRSLGPQRSRIFIRGYGREHWIGRSLGSQERSRHGFPNNNAGNAAAGDSLGSTAAMVFP